MFGLAYVQADGRKSRVSLDSFKQLVELLEGIRLEAVEIGIQFDRPGQAVYGNLPPSWLSLLIEAGL